MELSQDTLLAILAAVLIADVVVVLIALVWTQIQKRRQRSTPPVVTGPGSGAGPGFPGQGGAGVAANAGSAAHGAGFSASAVTMPRPGSGMPAPLSAPLSGAERQMPSSTSDTATDPLTGLLVPAAWSRIIADEEARIRRYHRPATVVLIEIEGLERLSSRLGPASVDRIVPAVADTLRRGTREADHVARLATGRFGILMPETDEVLAINYVERVRTACDLWLESGAVALRLAVGWASSTNDGSLVDAEAMATDRMYAELRRTARHAASGGPAAGADGGPGPEPAFGS